MAIEYSLLRLRPPTIVARSQLGGGRGQVHLPSRARQVARLGPQFRALENAFVQRRAQLQETAAGAEPEFVLVFEVAGTVDEFVRAVRNVTELEWLTALVVEELDPEPDFVAVDRPDQRIPGRLFLVMSNQEAMRELLRLWQRFVDGDDFQRGFAPFREVFKRLLRIRRWGAEDRLIETGVLADMQERLEAGQPAVRLEAELWYRRSEDLRTASAERFAATVAAAGGQILGTLVAEEIRYHGMLAELPAEAVAQVVGGSRDAAWLQADEIMFFDAAGQFVEPPTDQATETAPPRPQPEPGGTPIVALLDGFPLENHTLLSGRLIVDDPDGWGATYPTATRTHGTAMASVILHGDLSADTPPLRRPLYVRPIMRPATAPAWVAEAGEEIPPSELIVDLIRRAVARLYEAPGSTAPTVRIINLSVGQRFRQFDRSLSPWARIVDWLSFHYGALFVVSAGNHLDDIRLTLQAPWTSHTPEAIRTDLLRTIHAELRHRRLRPPAEAINALTVGAVHFDSSEIEGTDPRVDPLRLPMAAAYGALGGGFRRGIKPDVLAAGGRLVYDAPLGAGRMLLKRSRVTAYAPGFAVAAPTRTPGDLGATRFVQGTSVAAAVASRAAARIHDVLAEMREGEGDDGIGDEFDAVLMKVLVAHTARWQHMDEYDAGLSGFTSQAGFREYLSRHVGYGTLNPLRIIGPGNPLRGTAIRADRILAGTGHVYRLPLPDSLSGRPERRVLTVTLAWLTPISPAHHSYRSAALWFEIDRAKLGVDRGQADWQAARRGTLQHELFVGDHAVPYAAGTSLEIKVNCREDAPVLGIAVPYAVAVTLEVAPPSEVRVHQEIATRLRIPIRV